MSPERRFEDILDECMASVAEGRRTVEECLALNPRWAQRLEPLLRLATDLHDVYTARPSAARQAEGRRRFLAAAHGQPWPAPTPRRPVLAIPWPPRLPRHVPRPALAALAAVLLLVVAFPSFLLATSGDAMPGDWRYPAKRTSERLRFAFVFGEDARRSFRIGLAEERLDELEALVARGHAIDQSPIRELVSHTEPLVEDLDPQDPVAMPQEHVERIEVLTAREQEVLDQVEPLIEEQAADDLEQAKEVSSEGQVRAMRILLMAPPAEPQVISEGTPTHEPTASPEGTAEVTPETTVVAEVTVTPTPGDGASPSPTAGTPTGVALEPTGTPEATATATPVPTREATPPPPVMVREVTSLPEDSTGGVRWNLVRIGDFSVRVPIHQENGWIVSNPSPGEPSELLFIGHRPGTSFDAVVTINVASGEASIYTVIEGSSQTIAPEDVTNFVPSLADVVFHVLESISIGSP